MKELPKIYEPQKYEDSIYQKWEESGFFNPDNLPGKRKKPFSIVLPPPNVTGKLHLGHASMLSYQDIMIRYHRMCGDKTLWLPGMDHAAIATQNVVEKELNQEGQTRYDLGREKFLEKVNKFAEESKAIIRSQLKKMGSSLDWSREKFTLDGDLSKTVRYVFKKMYSDGLIYRGDRVVNWCPRCQTTLADDEVEYKEAEGRLYYIKYGPITIATTRPETKLGDTGLAVNPKDSRYKKYIGKVLEIDFTPHRTMGAGAWLAGHKIKVKVFADRAVDRNFGTGAIGVTPAHAHQDYLWSEKYNLPVIKVIDEQGKMTQAAGKYQGLATKDCREQFVRDLQKAGLIEKVEDYTNNLSVCYRCHTAVEPLTSKQWFVAVNKKIPWRFKTLKQLAVGAVKTGKIKIIPDRFNKTYFQWMDNLRDWCISRQIWYGHRIPVWYKKDKVYVDLEASKELGWIQDEDTLDTWFSSALWTFSTLGWPQKTQDLKEFHPTSVMETGYDILFFWVARMILMSEYLLKEKPFATVYLHGLVRTKEGEKMSKSKLETCIDPLAMIQKYGADALRLSMIVGATPGNDIRLYEGKIAGYRNFVNKLWNISRYILSSTQNKKLGKLLARRSPERSRRGVGGTLADRWILSELDKIIESTTKNIEQFRFSAAGEELYEFTWSKLADWYVEIAKIERNKSSATFAIAKKVALDKDEILLYILEKLLILWHPFCPFITEVLWKELDGKELLMVQQWPESRKQRTENTSQRGSRQEEQDFELIQKMVTAIRNIRSERRVNPRDILDCSVNTTSKVIKNNLHLISGLAKVKIISKVSGVKIHLPKVDLILAINENQGLMASRQSEIINLENYIKIQKQKLSNGEFIKKAPPPVVKGEQEKLLQARARLAKLK